MSRILNPKGLVEFIDEFRKAGVLVVGDMILDRYLLGVVERVSPEAPVPVHHVEREEERLGGAANVVHNIQALGARVLPLGVLGKDDSGDHLLEMLEKIDVDVRCLIRDSSRPTTCKSRIIAQSQQMIRVDREKRDDLSPNMEKRLVELLRGFRGEYDVVIIEDYGKGVVTPAVVKAVVEESRRETPNKVILVDPSATRMKRYRGTDILTPNHHEVARSVGRELLTEEDLESAANELIDQLEAKGILVTRGERGMSLFMKGEEPDHIPTKAREVYDVSGAGDTAVAVMAVAMAVGASPIEAAHLANYAGGIAVGKFGVATVSPQELRDACGE